MGRTPDDRKARTVAAVRADIERASAVFLTNVVGLSGDDAVRLRRAVREAGGGVTVARNTLLKRAAAGTPAEGLFGGLAGPNAAAFSFGDPAPVAKSLKDAGEELEAVRIKGGVIDGAEATAASILALADLPPRAEMLGAVLATMAAPLSSLVRLLDAVRRSREEAQGGQGAQGDEPKP